jgi:hypothetical protein
MLLMLQETKKKSKKTETNTPFWSKISIHMSQTDEHQRRKAPRHHHHHHHHQQQQQHYLATNPFFLAPSLFLLLLCVFCLLSHQVPILRLLVLFLGRRLKSAVEQKEITYQK